MSLTIEELKADIIILNGRKEKAIQDFHQIAGGISILEQMIYRIENHEATKDGDQSTKKDSIDQSPSSCEEEARVGEI